MPGRDGFAPFHRVPTRIRTGASSALGILQEAPAGVPGCSPVSGAQSHRGEEKYREETHSRVNKYDLQAVLLCTTDAGTALRPGPGPSTHSIVQKRVL